MRKFAIIHFLSDNTWEVVRTSDVQDFNEDDWRADKTQEWVVLWHEDKDTTEPCPGVVIAISDDKRSLAERRDKILNGGDPGTPVFGRGQKRANRTLVMDSSSQEISKKTRKDDPRGPNSGASAVSKQARPTTVSSPRSTLERDRARNTQEVPSRQSDEIKELRQQIKELTGQVQQLKAVITRMESLEVITRRLEVLLEAPANRNEATVQRRDECRDDIYTDKITKELVKRCNKMTEQKFVNDLLDGLYTKEFMATHTPRLPGRGKEKKTPLPRDDTAAIVGIVQHMFPHVSVPGAMLCIRHKLNNAGKAVTSKKSCSNSESNTQYDDGTTNDESCSNRDDNSDGEGENGSSDIED